MKGLIEYNAGESFLHKCNPLAKIITAFLMCMGCFVCDSVIYVLCVISLTVFMGYSAGVGKRITKTLISLLKLGLILFIMQIFFIREGNIILEFPFNIAVTDKGIHFCVLLALRISAATLPLVLMLMTTKITDISGSLVKKLHVPYKYAFALTTALRFIPVFANEMSDIIEAQTARGVEFDTKNPFKKIGLILPLCVPLLISSVKRIDDSSISARLRGFSLRTCETGSKSYPVRLRDAMMICAALFTAGGGVMVNFIFLS